MPLAVQCTGVRRPNQLTLTIAVEHVERHRLAGGFGQAFANRTRHRAEVELACDHARELWEAAAEPVLGSPRVAFDEGMPLQGAEQPERGGSMDFELARDLRSRPPAFSREEVEDRDRPVDGANHRSIARFVAHCAT